MQQLRTLITLLFLATGMVGWGQTTVTYDFSTVGAVSGLNETTPGISIDANIGFGSFRNSGTSNPGIFSSQLRLYQNATKGGSIKIYASNGVTITGVIIRASGTTGPAQYSVDGVGSTALSISGGEYTMASLSATSEVEFWCVGSSSGTRIYVDEIEVTYTSGPSPTITQNLTGFNGSFGSVNVGSSSASSSFTVEGSDLTDDITVTAPAGFEVSTDDLNWFASRTLTQSGGTVSATTIYVRFTPASAGAASDNVVLSSTGATSVNVPVSGTGTNPNDADTEVFGPISQVGAKSIVAASVTTLGNATEVFAFEIEDQGTADGLNTLVTQVRVVPGAGNTADWTDFIQGVRLWDGSSFVTIGSATISDTEIIIPISSGDLVITDGNSTIITLYVYLNTSNIVDQQVLDFSIPATGHGFIADAAGSGFNPTFTLGAIDGNDITVDVDYTALAFVQQPTNTNVNDAMSPAVTVEAVDANGNRDTDYNLDVDITSTGTLTGSPVTTVAVSGLATFSTLTHTATGTGLQLTASDGLVTDVTSGTFDIITLPTLIITEVTDPGDVFAGRFVEIYNYGSSSLDLAVENIHFTVQVNGGTSTNSTALTGSLEPGGIMVIGNSSNILSNYGFAADVDYGSVNGNGDDSYHLYYGGDHTAGTLLDSYGVLGQDGTGQAWEYTDSRAVRNSPATTVANSTWTALEWTITSANLADMTPGALENEFRYDGDWKPRDANVHATSTDDILVYANVSTTADWQVSTLQVQSGVEINIQPGNEIEVVGNLTNNGSIVLNADATGYAQLKVNGTISGSGTATVEQYIPSSGWRNIGLPLASGTALSALGTIGTDVTTGVQNLYYWDAANTQWVNVVNGSETHVEGRGYIAYFGGSYGVGAAPSTISVTGSLTQSVAPVVNYSGATGNEGWNLVSNPFSCGLDFGALSGRQNMNNSFSRYNAGTGSYSSYSGASADLVDRIIPPMGSFWVRATAGSPSLGTLNMATHGTVGAAPTFFKNQTTIADRFFLNVFEAADPLKQDEFLLAMIPGTQDANDQEWDAFKRLNDAQVPSLMSVANGDELAINAIDYSPNSLRTKKLQLRFVSGKNNEIYFIELHDSLLTNNYHIELEDLKLRRKHNLKSAPYKFVHDQNAEYRFVLHISPVTTINQGHTHTPVVNGGVNVGINGGTLVLKMNAPQQDVQGALLDLNGRRVMDVEYPAGVEQYEINVNGLAKGVYLLQLQAVEGDEVHKVILP